jgi:hypothetical protein
MHITKHSITLDSTHSGSSTGSYFYSETSPNGLVHAIEYTRGSAAYASTGVLALYAGSTIRSLIAKSFSTDSWIVYPRKSAVDTTAAGFGSSTDPQPMCIPLSGTDRIVAGITGGTSAAQTGTVHVYMEG